MSSAEFAVAALLNRECDCVGTDVGALHARLQSDVSSRGPLQPILNSHPHLFSAAPVFVAGDHILRMQRLVDAIEAVIALPAYRESVLARAPKIARGTPAPRGVFMGFDFHLSEAVPKLIEINTNAGGAMLSAAMGRAQRVCCPGVLDYLGGQPDADLLEDAFFGMFVQEWRRARGVEPLTSIAIVDDEPAGQYLYPEFLLFQRLFAAQGLQAIIVSPADLEYRAGALWHGDTRIDMVYNRLTDFYFADARNAALAESYIEAAAVITPHPHAHALYADKRNLALLSDESELRAFGVPGDALECLLAGIPRTAPVLRSDEQRWWNERKQWFFKPSNGYGSRGCYRGDKLTRKVFKEMMQRDYVAQALVLPGERTLRPGPDNLRFDIRNYVYAGRTQLMAARLYQGQTTNFRTPGGGFAPVYSAPRMQPGPMRPSGIANRTLPIRAGSGCPGR